MVMSGVSHGPAWTSENRLPALLWLVIVVILAGIASFLPARSASRLTVREVLSYE